MTSSDFVPQFIKCLTNEDCNSNELLIPSKFSSCYGGKLADNLNLKIRNGYKIPVTFDRSKSVFVGLTMFYQQFLLRGGETLVFEFRDEACFKVFIISTGGSEIYYPDVVHPSQNLELGRVKIAHGGWRFLKTVKESEEITDEIRPPSAFLTRWAPHMSTRIKFFLSNGKKFVGEYYRRNQTLYGLAEMCDELGLVNFNSLDTLIFKFEYPRSFIISMFDGRNVENLLHQNSSDLDSISASITPPARFEIEVQPFHMYDYCHGVDISKKFKDLCRQWDRSDHLTVFKDNRSWILEIRHRSDGKRTTIHGGWIIFRDELGLQTGDKCMFKWKDECICKYTVEVKKYV